MQKNLSDATVKNHIRCLGIFLKFLGKNIDSVGIEDVQDFMLEIKRTKASETYKNYLAMLKILFRDFLKQGELINDFKFPQQQAQPKILPSKQQLKTFFEAMPSLKYKIIFLALASSGLRISELLGAHIDRAQRMIVPQTHDGSTKKAWVSFYNEETAELIDAYEGNPFNVNRNTVAHVFAEVADETGIDISTQTLRSVFAREMGLKGVQDRYIDAFCSRTPASVLARHYSDFSPEVLKEIYEKTNINILN